MNKLNVISGCPRSGTSIMSLCMLSSIGDDNLIAKAFPQESKPTLDNMEEGELKEYYKKTYKQKKVESGYKDLNPMGFWECRYSVKGIQYHDDFPKLEGKYCKIVSQGIAASNPEYINKIILMARNPRQVAKSQERLKREMEGVVHSPDMFIRVTYQLAKWLLCHDKGDDTLIVNYDNLVSDPSIELDRVADFLELDRSSFDHTLVDPNLKRSKPENIEHHLWEVADKIFSCLLVKDWQGIIDAFMDSKALINRENTRIPCERTGRRMAYNQCINCVANKSTRTNFRKNAEKKGIDWINKPCMFLCNASTDGPLIPLQETIDNNHWLADTDFTPPTAPEVASMALGTVARVAMDVLKGKKTKASKETIASRQATCDTCPFRKGTKCTACSCKLPRKMSIAQSKCPKNRWAE